MPIGLFPVNQAVYFCGSNNRPPRLNAMKMDGETVHIREIEVRKNCYLP
jgi:hypothetical protein